MIDDKNKCKTCNGKKVVKEKKVIEANIDKGTPNGYQYTFHGEADEYPGMEPGDVVIVAQEQPHKKFKRKGADLLIEKQITLLEALTGVDFVITHLDGNKIRIKNDPGEVIKPDDLKTVIGKGLPFHKKAYETGNLYIIFKVSFPDKLQLKQVEALKLCLAEDKKKGGKDNDETMDASETCKLIKYDENQRNTHA